MADDKPPMPQQPTTKQLDRSDIIQRQLEKLLEGQNAMGAAVTSLHEDLKDVQSMVRRHDDEIREFGEWRARVSNRIGTHSERAKQDSQVDMARDAKLAEEIIARQALEKQHAEEKARREKLEAEMVTKADLAKITASQTSAIVDDVKAALKKPMVQKILWALGGLILVAINAATTYLTSGAHHP